MAKNYIYVLIYAFFKGFRTLAGTIYIIGWQIQNMSSKYIFINCEPITDY